MIPFLLAVREISPFEFQELYTSEETHSGPSQASKTSLFVRIVNTFKLMLLAFLERVS